MTHALLAGNDATSVVAFRRPISINYVYFSCSPSQGARTLPLGHLQSLIDAESAGGSSPAIAGTPDSGHLPTPQGGPSKITFIPIRRPQGRFRRERGGLLAIGRSLPRRDAAADSNNN